jgi:hypothetical protein
MSSIFHQSSVENLNSLAIKSTKVRMLALIFLGLFTPYPPCPPPTKHPCGNQPRWCILNYTLAYGGPGQKSQDYRATVLYGAL